MTHRHRAPRRRRRRAHEPSTPTRPTGTYVKVAAVPRRAHRGRGRAPTTSTLRRARCCSLLLMPMMIVKFAMVAACFMHLRFDSRLFRRLFVAGHRPGRRRVHRSSLLDVPRSGRQRTCSPLPSRPTSGGGSRTPRSGCSSPASSASACYAVRVIGPEGGARRRADRHPPPGGLVRRRRRRAAGLASDWPVHDIAEEYLYRVHMVQHLLLTFVVAAAVPAGHARRGWPGWCVGDGWFAGRRCARLARPVAAGVIFNAVVVFTHWPATVNASVENGAAALRRCTCCWSSPRC